MKYGKRSEMISSLWCSVSGSDSYTWSHPHVTIVQSRSRGPLEYSWHCLVHTFNVYPGHVYTYIHIQYITLYGSVYIATPTTIVLLSSYWERNTPAVLHLHMYVILISWQLLVSSNTNTSQWNVQYSSPCVWHMAWGEEWIKEGHSWQGCRSY